MFETAGGIMLMVPMFLGANYSRWIEHHGAKRLLDLSGPLVL